MNCHLNLFALIFILIFCTSLHNVYGQEVSIGLEIDSTHDVLFGVPIGQPANKFYWSSEHGTLMAGTDYITKGHYSWDLNDTGNWSAIFGENNSSTGDGSIVWGSENQILADYGAAWGKENRVQAVRSTVWGRNNKADGFSSTVMGFGNVSKHSYELVIGIFNDTIPDPDIMPLGSEDPWPLLTIGNGIDDQNRSNALSVFTNGFTKIGKGIPEADLHINQSEINPDGGTGGIRLQAFLSNWQIYTTGNDLNFARNGSRVAYINHNGDFISLSEMAFDPIPSEKLKLAQTTDIISKVNLSQSNKSTIQIDGYQLLKDAPQLVEHNNLSGEPESINYRQLYLTAIAALQEEIEINKKQQAEIDELKEIVYNR